jgi:hypothetical protein
VVLQLGNTPLRRDEVGESGVHSQAGLYTETLSELSPQHQKKKRKRKKKKKKKKKKNETKRLYNRA